MIVKHETVVEIVRSYESARAAIVDSFEQIEASLAALNESFVLGEEARHSQFCLKGYHDRAVMDFADPERCLVHLRRDVWKRLIERLELQRIMSIRRWKDFSKLVSGECPPEIDIETVTAFGRQYAAMIPEMATESVKEVFNLLRPQNRRGTSFATNDQHVIGPRVILSSYVEANWVGPGFSVDHDYRQHLTAIENVMQLLDGQGFANKTHSSELEAAIKASAGGTGETRYFEFRCFKKGTLHLRFKRLDLVKRLNMVAGGMNLRPGDVEPRDSK